MTDKIAKQFPVQKRVALRSVEIEAIELAARGLNQREIGERLGRTRSGIGKMLRRTETKLAEMLKETGAQIKARQTMSLEHIYREAMGAWGASKNDAQSSKKTDGPEDFTRTETTLRDQTGDPRYLDQARGALGDIRKIWGLDAHDGTATQGVNVQVNFTDDFFGLHPPQIVETTEVTPKVEANGHSD